MRPLGEWLNSRRFLEGIEERAVKLPLQEEFLTAADLKMHQTLFGSARGAMAANANIRADNTSVES